MTYDYIEVTHDFHNEEMFHAAMRVLEIKMQERDFPELASEDVQTKLQLFCNKYYKVIRNTQVAFTQADIDLFASIYTYYFRAMRSAELVEFSERKVHEIYNEVEFEEV